MHPAIVPDSPKRLRIVRPVLINIVTNRNQHSSPTRRMQAMRHRFKDGELFIAPTNCSSRTVKAARSSSVRKLPTSQARPPDSRQSRLGCRVDDGARSLTLVQCRENLVVAGLAPSCALMMTSVSVMTMHSCCFPRRMEWRNAQASSSNSSPANGSTGQKPRSMQNPQVSAGPTATEMKNQRAPFDESELCASSTIRSSPGPQCSRARLVTPSGAEPDSSGGLADMR